MDKILNDKIMTFEQFEPTNKSGFKTEIIATDEFGNELFRSQNQTVLGGGLFVLEKLFNIRSKFNVATINKIMGIDEKNPVGTEKYTADDVVCLWGIGCGGSGDAFGSVREVKYYEREIGNNGQSQSEMIPFRMVKSPLDADETNKYHLRKQIGEYYAYYAKEFEVEPFIKVLWKDGANGEDGNEVTEEVYGTERTDEIETFIEIHLKLTKNDIVEWFDYNNNVEKARVNTIGLFFARKAKVEDVPERYDYINVKLFSKLTFDNEPKGDNKEINFTYRIFVA